MDKSDLLRKIRRSPVTAKIDDMFRISQTAKSWRNKTLTKELVKEFYTESLPVESAQEQVCVAMFDGRVNQGGLCDRLWGIISTYLYCKDNSIPFKLHFTVPFKMSDYLVPASVDWMIDGNEISFNQNTSAPLVIKCLGYGREDDMSPISKALNRGTKQLHLYTNAHTDPARFHEGFHDLFKPTDVLQRAVDEALSVHGDDYVSLSFRFVRLFGDFEDINWPVLPDEKSREEMIQRGLQAINHVKSLHPGKKLLVTTDSITFLNRARQVDGVFVVDGEIKHVDYSSDDSGSLTHLKTFLDLLLIARAKYSYLGMNDMVYRSTFAATASLIGNHPFEMIAF